MGFGHGESRHDVRSQQIQNCGNSDLCVWSNGYEFPARSCSKSNMASSDAFKFHL
uniref:Uncharacterized protein n=1 Tax=Picea sitchensis TaxID=3332 RepID=A9NY40_PICSI|nr:unknown [Picea sitchensis]